MPMTERSSISLIVFTFFAALLLTILPMPSWAVEFRPPWASLILIFWCITAPQQIGVLIGWCVGLLVDVLIGAMLGEHALMLAITAFICHKLYNRIRVFPIWQQALFVFLLVLIERIVSFWVRSSFDQMTSSLLFWAPAFVGGIVWPWLYIILRDLKRRFSTP